MSKRNIHIVPRGNNWGVLREGGDRVSGIYPRQSDAQDAAIPTARRDGVDIVIHRPNGQIRDRDSYGNDPHPPIDKKH
jgi:hypothetical protein